MNNEFKKAKDEHFKRISEYTERGYFLRMGADWAYTWFISTIDSWKKEEILNAEIIEQLQAELDLLEETLIRHAGYLEHQCKCYNAVKKERIAIVKILPPIKRLMLALEKYQKFKGDKSE